MKHLFLLLTALTLVLLPRCGLAQGALSDKYRQHAEDLYAKADYQRAGVWYEKAYDLVKRTDPVRAANLCVDISSLDYMAGHHRVAADRCLRGLRHLRTATPPPDSVSFKLFSSLGLFYFSLYRSDSARFNFQKADDLLIRNPLIEKQIPLYVLHHFDNQGSWFFTTGNYSRNLSCLTKARVIAEQFGQDEDIAYIESNLAGCYAAMGNDEQARQHIIVANRYYHKYDVQKCRFLSGIGWLTQKTNRLQEALINYNDVQEILKRLRPELKTTEFDFIQIQLWWMTGTCYLATNQFDKADHYLQQAIQKHQQQIGRQGPLLATILVAIGQLHEARQESEQALFVYQAAMRVVCRDTTNLANPFQNPSVESASDETMLLTATRHKAALLTKLHQATRNDRYQQAAVETYRLAIGLQQRIRHGIDTEQSQLVFTEKHHALVPAAIAVAFDAYRQRPTPARRETLFQFFEQARWASLSEALRLNTIKPQTIPPALLDRELSLKRQISDLRRKPATDTTAATALTNCQLQWYRLVETFRLDYPAYYQLNYRDAPLSSHTLQRQLDGQTAYVSYVRQGAGLYILVATASTLDIVRQPLDSARFDRQLRTLQAELYKNPIFSRYKGIGPASGIYQTCIEPILPYLTGKTRLIIARDWSFNALPFEVLENGRRANDYLTKHYAIAYAFSAQLFFERHYVPIATRPVLVVAPFARAGAIDSKAIDRQAPFRPLVSSETEARSIGGDLLLGPAATLTRFRKTDLHRNVLYLATHAQTDDADPANSHILFYPDGNNKLYTDDIYDLPLSKTGLVVLGACETGSGKTATGEGVLSLARAFAYAGCPSVVTTLWKANDETTSFLTVRLHHHLAHGLPIDKALQQARLDFFASPRFPKFNHPYYWANFTLLGSYNPVMDSSTQPTLVWWLAAATLLGLTTFWQRNRLRHLLPITRPGYTRLL